jgi:hypothetical protein
MAERIDTKAFVHQLALRMQTEDHVASAWLEATLETLYENFHIPSNLVVECVTIHRKPPEVRIWRVRNQSWVGTRPPSTSTPH